MIGWENKFQLAQDMMRWWRLPIFWRPDVSDPNYILIGRGIAPDCIVWIRV